jgi:hypothetical protein
MTLSLSVNVKFSFASMIRDIFYENRNVYNFSQIRRKTSGVNLKINIGKIIICNFQKFILLQNFPDEVDGDI